MYNRIYYAILKNTRRLSGEKLKCEDFYIKKSALLMFNYFTQRSQGGKDRQERLVEP